MVMNRLTYHHPPQTDFRQQLAQIDWLGAFFLMISVSIDVSFCRQFQHKDSPSELLILRTGRMLDDKHESEG